ncbi:rhomboid family intramembrane serine protease [Flammeovirgaceae bacterium SG7u.111]|nr:rhomboid family intramembrane serine protease [Flammeovirgaceae bacterium SG7u.132]WPO33830.1 rhomboid family intramembrane serine protease [Flammeovirgaceae bacterium SG7u.111]
MKISYNSPVILTYTFLCVGVLIIGELTGNAFMSLFTVSSSMNLLNPLDYFRLVSHVIGHANWPHLINNLTFILLIGPILEEKYGSKPMLYMMLITALVTGIINVLFFSTGLLGGSGIVFMLILLGSIVNLRQGTIPLTFVLVVLLFLGREVISIFDNDNISQFAHILGGIFGSVFGFKRNATITEKKYY